ncbi:uncharacterized protein LOC117110233 [Anneissia japonica]|uniref:uncharacterized protein LOC117110233 n=1 Tax=Anneissia japonica TaxID=1529436 RepID=UPI001425A8D8|nr:uncharacterized protein LOC117110233 [Anneissia japonica]
MRSLCVAVLLITKFPSNCNFRNAEETIDARSRTDLVEIMQTNKSYAGEMFDDKHVNGGIPKGTKIRKIILKQDVDREALSHLWERTVPGTYQGDMILTVDQELALLKLEETQGEIHKRGAVQDIRWLWPQAVIPFIIGKKIENSSAILAAMRYVESVSCLKFVPNNSSISETLGHKSYIHIDLGDRCVANIGKYGSRRQPLRLTNRCLQFQGNIVHELLHTAGFYHEQSRPDRDEYVQINWLNIAQSKAYNFVKENINTNYPYDLNSILHYGRNVFAIDGRFPSIKTVNPLLQYDVGGDRRSMTYNDIHILNDVYSCSAGCPETDCGNGFLGARCECFCFKADENEPDDYCNDQPAEMLRGCRYNLTATSGTITSPNFPSPYDDNTHCLWYIHAEEGNIITLTFHTFSIESSPGCKSDFLQVRDKDVYEETENLCGYRIPGKVISDRNEMLLYFNTDNYISSMGFNVTYVITDHSHLDYSNCWMKSCYINLNQRALWSEAEALCVQEGGHLPVINNEDENEFIRRYIARCNIDIVSWIGYKSIGKGKKWNWVIEEPTAKFTSWHPTQPISSKKGQCATASVYGFWESKQCASSYFPVICETPSKTTEAILYDWETWTSCTVSCGGGTRRRHRQCSQPGLCSGNLRESDLCGKVPCSNRIIKGHNATMSSMFLTRHAMKAVDGHPWPSLWHESCSETNGEWEPWWMVDLGEFYVVEKIIITKMADYGGDHLIGAVVRVGNVLVAKRNMKCGPTINKTMVALDYHIDIECAPAIVGRYVSIQMENLLRSLTLCEVEVYTTVLEFPILTCPPRASGIAREGASTAEVFWYSPIVIDPFERTFDVLCIPERNSKFQSGSSNVTCLATAEDGTTLSCWFPVTVIVHQSPIITCLPRASVFARAGASTANVYWNRPKVNDPFERTFDVVCIPETYSKFQLGSSNVTCVATAEDGVTFSCGFTLTVKGINPLSLTCPNDIKLHIKRSTSGKIINYSAPLLIDADHYRRRPTITCSHPSGTLFPLGKTDVKCSAVLDQRILASCSFRVKLKECKDEFLESCYIYISAKRSFNKQVSICQEAGGSLVNIHSQEENKFLTNKFLGLSRKYMMYAGLRYRLNSGWKWENGQGIEDFKNWASSQPMEYTKGKSCVALKPNGKWMTYNCKTKLRTICELDIGG